MKEKRISGFDEHTEILTKEGFKYFRDLSNDSQIATLTQKEKQIEYQEPDEIYQYNYDNELLHFTGKYYNVMVTPNQSMWGWEFDGANKSSNFIPIKAVNLEKLILKRSTPPFQLKRDGIWHGESKDVLSLPKVKAYGRGWAPSMKNISNVNTKTWLKFMGYYIGDGSSTFYKYKEGDNRYIISIRNTVPEELDEIENIINNLGFTAQKRYKSEAVRITSKQLYSYLKKFGGSEAKYIPKRLKKLSKQYLQILFNCLIKSDGCHSSRDKERGLQSFSYATISEQLADDIQEISLKLGMVSNLSTRTSTTDWSYGREYYSISIYNNMSKPLIHNPPKSIQYNGKIYNIEIPNNIICTRRNGLTLWSGSYD